MFDQIKLKVGITPTNKKLKTRADIRKNFLPLFDMINLFKGFNDFYEIGPSKVLSGLVKKINKDVKINNINSLEDIKK